MAANFKVNKSPHLRHVEDELLVSTPMLYMFVINIWWTDVFISSHYHKFKTNMFLLVGYITGVVIWHKWTKCDVGTNVHYEIFRRLCLGQLLHGWDWCFWKHCEYTSCICAVKYICIAEILSIATASFVLHDRNNFYCYRLSFTCRVLVVQLVCPLELENALYFVLSTNPNLLVAGSIICQTPVSNILELCGG